MRQDRFREDGAEARNIGDESWMGGNLSFCMEVFSPYPAAPAAAAEKVMEAGKLPVC